MQKPYLKERRFAPSYHRQQQAQISNANSHLATGTGYSERQSKTGIFRPANALPDKRYQFFLRFFPAPKR